MSLTVTELTEIPYLRTTLIGGRSGAGNVIDWAHSIELPRPWEWLESGDLLMTVGLGIPADEEQQRDYVEQLAAVGVSGVAIGENMQSPPIGEAMLGAAEAEGLPILVTAYEVPFVQISRAVAEGSRRESARLVRAARIYDRARAAVGQDQDGGELLAAMETELACRLWVCSNETGALLVSGSSRLPTEVAASFRNRIADQPRAAPGLLRLPLADSVCLVVPVPTRTPASLLAVPTDGPTPPYGLLQHVATVAALQVQQQYVVREERRRVGAELFADMREGRVSTAGAEEQLAVHGFAGGPYVILAVAGNGAEGERWRNLHHALAEVDVPGLLIGIGETFNLFVPADQAILERALALVAPGEAVGISDPFSGSDIVPGALREARWALERARAEGSPVLRYGEGAPLFGPRSLADAKVAVRRVLGPLLEYDEAHDADLVRSLQVFLAANRSWKQAAEQLFIHKQTLIYRIRRVEELTGRSLSDTDDVATLWLALKSLPDVDREKRS